MNTTYSIPRNVMKDLERHARDVERYLAGELSHDMFKARRVPRGIYEQRQNGLYMVRVRVAGGSLWASQAHRLAELSRRYADGKIHITTRQDIQLHQVKIEDTYAIMKGLLEVGLTPYGGGGNTVRNVTSCANGGFARDEVFNTQPYALAVTNYLLQFESSFNLPRKFKIAFSGCQDDCALAGVNDLGFVARFKGGKPGFAVYVGGGMGTRSRAGDLYKEFVPVEDTLRIVEAVKRIFIRYGDRRNPHRARLRFVVERLGVDKFFSELEQELRRVTEEGVPDAIPVELEAGPRPPEGDPLNCVVDETGFEIWQKTAVRPQQQEGYFSVTVMLKRGDLPANDLDRLAELAKLHAGSQLRTDRLQNFIIPHIPAEHLKSVYHELQDFSVDVTGRLSSEALLVSCKGAATCRLGICRSQDLNAAISEAAVAAGIDQSVFSEVEIHTSGCPNNCGQHAIAPLGFFGAARINEGRSYPSYFVVVGGRTGRDGTALSQPVIQLPAKNIPGFTVELFKDYMNSQHRHKGFLAYWEEGGRKLALKLAEKYSDLPSYEYAPEFYRDWGSDEDFSLAGRGPGECGAGIFELIAQELKKAERAYSVAQDASVNPTQRAQHLLQTVTLAAGALLVTKGIEPGNPDVSAKGFEDHFIDTGIASERYRDLLVLTRLALRGNEQLLLDQVETVRSFLNEVQQLYDAMDASLNFPVKTGDRPGTNGESPASQELDLRGVKCPMNFVHAKIALEQLDIGQVLDVILDDGEPVKNVPASFRAQGQEVIALTPEDKSSFRVRIRRAQ